MKGTLDMGNINRVPLYLEQLAEVSRNSSTLYQTREDWMYSANSSFMCF